MSINMITRAVRAPPSARRLAITIDVGSTERRINEEKSSSHVPGAWRGIEEAIRKWIVRFSLFHLRSFIIALSSAEHTAPYNLLV